MATSTELSVMTDNTTITNFTTTGAAPKKECGVSRFFCIFEMFRGDSGARPNITTWMQEVVKEESHMHLIMLCIVAPLVVVTLVLALMQYCNVRRHVSSPILRSDLYYIIMMNPIVSLCAIFGMIMPRSMSFLYAVSLTYYMLCLRVVINIMFMLSGGRQKFSKVLMIRGSRVKTQSPPACCFFRCLPEVDSTENNLRRIEFLVEQTIIVRVLLQIIDRCMENEFTDFNHLYFKVSTFISFVSMIIAIYGCYLLVPLNREALRPFGFTTLFRIVDISQSVFTIQRMAIDFSYTMGLFDGARTSDNKIIAGLFIFDFVVCIEMAVLSIVGTVLLRPKLSAMFDKYGCRLPVAYAHLDENEFQPVAASSKSVATALPEKSKEKSQTRSNKSGKENKSKNREPTVEGDEDKKAKLKENSHDDGGYEDVAAFDEHGGEQELLKVLTAEKKTTTEGEVATTQGTETTTTTPNA